MPEDGMDESASPSKSERTKHQKFRKLAESRTNKALDAIGRIGNLSNRALYEWSDDEVEKVIAALRDAVSEVETRFTAPKGNAGARFKL